ncbi:hypothetical protein HDU98_008668, partial [Podochytrium sp. JEL0797]
MEWVPSEVERGLHSIYTLFSWWLKNNDFLGSSTASILLAETLITHTPYLSEPHPSFHNPATYLTLLSCLTNSYAKLSDSIDSTLPTALEAFLSNTTPTVLYPHESWSSALTLLEPYLCSIPSTALSTITTSLLHSESHTPSSSSPTMAAQRFLGTTTCFESVFLSRWEFVDERLWGYERPDAVWVVRVWERWVLGRGEAEKVVCFVPGWLDAVMKVVEDVGVGKGSESPKSMACAIAVILALVRAISSRIANPTAKPLPSAETAAAITSQFGNIMKRAATMLAVSFDAGLQTVFAHALYEYFGFHGSDSVFEGIVLESDSCFQSLLALLTSDLTTRINHSTTTQATPLPPPSHLLTQHNLATLSKSIGTCLHLSLTSPNLTPHASQILTQTQLLCSTLCEAWLHLPPTSPLLQDKPDPPASARFEAFNLSLFSVVMILKMGVDTLTKQTPKPNDWTRTAAYEILDALQDVHFVTCRFGLDPFAAWKDAFYGSIRLLERQETGDVVVDRYLSRINSSIGSITPPTEFPNTYTHPRTLFVLLLIQHTWDTLTPLFFETRVATLVDPYLTYRSEWTETEMDLYEMGHWVYFAVWEGMSEGGGVGEGGFEER